MSLQTKVALARDGNNEAKEYIYRRFYGDVYRYCVYRCGNIHTGEDLAQEVFLRIFRYKDTAAPDKNLKSYVLRTACNVCNSYSAAAAPPLPLDDTLLPGDSVPPLSAEQEAVRCAVLKLDDISRQIVILYYFNGLRTPQISEILRLPLSTVKTRLRRARERLKQILIQEGFN